MNIKILSAVAMATATLVSASAANAGVTLSSVIPATSSYSGPTPTYTFEGGSTTPTYTGGTVVTGDVGGIYVTPTGSTGNYYAVGPNPATTTPGIISLAGLGPITSLSFLWGSVDLYNTLTFVGPSILTSYTFTGNDIVPGADGSQTELVTFLFSGASTTNITGLRLSSTDQAFEIDNIAINPVPEPGTWALMLLGFGAIGLAMRSRRRQALAQLA